MQQEKIYALFTTQQVRQACIPSANGHYSARALARLYAVLANGGELDGKRFFSKERITEMWKVRGAGSVNNRTAT